MTGQTVTSRYQAFLKERGFHSDPAQTGAVARLQRLYEELSLFRQARRSLFKRLLNRPEVPRGVWLYGGVGRGKSFLMDCFYATVPVRRKTRIHFHEFMRGVHLELDQIKGTEDPLQTVAARIAKRYRLICFDEFHVSDIADAMILSRLLEALFNAGTVFVMTSNYQPDGLYPEGLNRHRIMPAIGLLNSHLDVVSVDAGVDYRQMSMSGLRTYYFPLDKASAQALTDAFDAIAEVPDEPVRVDVEHRQIDALRRAGGVIWFGFDTLCGGPRSQNDYLELALRFHTVILSDVPQLTPAMSSQARRFLWLVDVFYDQRVKLLISAACEPEALYTSGAMVNEFARTVSRLMEMQTQAYLNEPRRGMAQLLAGEIAGA